MMDALITAALLGLANVLIVGYAKRLDRANEVEVAALVDDRPFREQPTVQRIAAVMAHSEAARFDPETADWSAPARWVE